MRPLAPLLAEQRMQPLALVKEKRGVVAPPFAHTFPVLADDDFESDAGVPVASLACLAQFEQSAAQFIAVVVHHRARSVVCWRRRRLRLLSGNYPHPTRTNLKCCA